MQGIYTPLSDIDSKTYEEMIEKHIIFDKNDRFLESAGAYKFWPIGRGIFRNKNETFLVWINEEDHMRIVSIAKSGDLGSSFLKKLNDLNINFSFLCYRRSL